VRRIVFTLAIVGLVASSRTSAASGWINVTAVDSVLIGSTHYPRFTFAVHNPDPFNSPGYPICTVGFWPQAPAASEDTCRVIAASAPADWTGVTGIFQHVTYAHTDGTKPCIERNETVGGFQIVLSKAHHCCYDVYFYGALFDPWYQDVACFDSDQPVPAGATSWGRVKSIYRQ